MFERLSETLMRRGLLDARRSTEASERKAFAGGALDTALLELGFVTEPQLLEALRDTYGSPVGGAAEAMRPPDARAARALPEHWARKHTIAPLVLDQEGSGLTVLSPAPPDAGQIDSLGAALGLTIRAVVSAEFRVHQRLALLYNSAPPDRYRALIDAHRDRSRTSLDGSQYLGDEPLGTGERLTFDDALARLRAASDRDEIIRTTLLYASCHLEFVASFVVHAERLDGWMTMAGDGRGLEGVSISLSEDSAFSVVVTNQAHYLGSPSGTPSSAAFLERMGRSTSHAALIVPIRIKNRVVALVYGDNGSASIPSQVVADLVLFITHVQQAFESLLLRKKTERSAPPPVSDSESSAPPPPSPSEPLRPTLEPHPVESPPPDPPQEHPQEPRPRLAEEEDGFDLLGALADAVAEVEALSPRMGNADLTAPAEESWHDVAVETWGASEEPVPLTQATTPKWDPEVLVAQLVGPDPSLRSASVEGLYAMGSGVLSRVMTVFPGVLHVDPFEPVVRLPDFSECGELLRLLSRFGSGAHPHVAPRLDVTDRCQRFFATYFYAAVLVPENVPRLTQRLHDEEPRIGMLAASTLSRYREFPEFQAVLQHLHGRLYATSIAARRNAVVLIGQFRDVSAVPKLIGILARKEKALLGVVEDALAEITKQRMGPSERKWVAWWNKNSGRSRITWLIEGLASDEAGIRRSSAEELRYVTGVDIPCDADAPRKQRDEARRRWIQWWDGQESLRKDYDLSSRLR